MFQVLACGAAIVTLSMGIRHGFGLWLQPITQEMGWTRQSTDRSKTGAAMLERASDTGSRPNVLFPVTSGNPMGAPT